MGELGKVRFLIAGACERRGRSSSDERVESILRDRIERLRPGLGARVSISFTNNSSTMVSKSEGHGTVHLRLHRVFRKAPEDLLEDLVRFFFKEGNSEAARGIRGRLIDFVAEHHEETLHRCPPNRILPPRGQVYDLLDVLDRVRRIHLPELPSRPAIGWTHRFHRTLMGKWIQSPTPHPNTILINRLLDHPRVPRYYLEFVVHHELLHELLSTGRRSGRWVHHPPEFRSRERSLPIYGLARDWERRKLERLYRSARICRSR